MIKLIFLMIIENLSADNFYISTNSCVFDKIRNFPLISSLECAIECEASECKAFQYSEQNASCSLYSFLEICQSNTNCTNVTIFINNRYNNKYISDITSVPYQLFNGVYYKYDWGGPSVFSVLNPRQTSVIITGDQQKPIIVIGSYNNSKSIFYPKAGLVESLDLNRSFPYGIPENFIAYLTNGKCVNNYRDCYRPVKTYKKHVGIHNLVFGVQRESVFNVMDLKNEIIKNNWHLIISGTFWVKSISNSTQSLARLYGICITRNTGNVDFYIRHNICKNVTNYKRVKC